jgi:hypothetical protein
MFASQLDKLFARMLQTFKAFVDSTHSTALSVDPKASLDDQLEAYSTRLYELVSPSFNFDPQADGDMLNAVNLFIFNNTGGLSGLSTKAALPLLMGFYHTLTNTINLTDDSLKAMHVRVAVFHLFF